MSMKNKEIFFLFLALAVFRKHETLTLIIFMKINENHVLIFIPINNFLVISYHFRIFKIGLKITFLKSEFCHTIFFENF